MVSIKCRHTFTNHFRKTFCIPDCSNISIIRGECANYKTRVILNQRRHKRSRIVSSRKTGTIINIRSSITQHAGQDLSPFMSYSFIRPDPISYFM